MKINKFRENVYADFSLWRLRYEDQMPILQSAYR